MRSWAMTRQNVLIGDQLLLPPAASPYPEQPDARNSGRVAWSPADYIRLLNINTAKVGMNLCTVHKTVHWK